MHMNREKRGMHAVAVLVLAGVVLAGSGCATRSYVQEEIRSAESRQQAALEARRGDVDGRIEAVERASEQREERLGDVEGRLARHGEGLSVLARRFATRRHLVTLDEGNVFFGFDSAELTPEARATLDALAAKALRNREILLAVEGHTDATGPKDYNFRLSRRRADSVIRYLVMEKNLDLTRIFSLGVGELDPAEKNSTPEGRRMNRRVTVLLLAPSWARQGEADETTFLTD